MLCRLLELSTARFDQLPLIADIRIAHGLSLATDKITVCRKYESSLSNVGNLVSHSCCHSLLNSGSFAGLLEGHDGALGISVAGASRENELFFFGH